MFKSRLRVIALAGALLTAAPGILSAQSQEEAVASSEAVPVTDTLSVHDGQSAVERLKAKVDSLRQALAESPERRRQGVARRLATADSLHRAYDFTSAVGMLRDVLADADSSQASAVEEVLLRSREGLRMTGAVAQLRVTARGRISKEEFFQLYPEAEDETGYHSLSPDGRTLYFSSKDITGAGGYDLFVSHRDRSSGGWSAPVNMGLPYSSPFNDLLYADTGDGEHSVLVSDRGCPSDSLFIYVLAYDPLPQKRAVNDARVLRTLAGLQPARRMPAPAPGRNSRTGVDMSAYTARTAAVRALRDSVTICNNELDALREGLAEIPEEKQEGYLAGLLAKELGLENLKKRLEEATRVLQDIEQNFLAGGMGQNRPRPQAQPAPSDSLAVPVLMLVTEDGDSFMEMEESGARTRILPEGSFGDYIVYPPVPSFKVTVFIPDGSELPEFAMTVMRLHSRTPIPSRKTEDGTLYTAGPFNYRLKAESLRMALQATGVAKVSLTED